MTDRDPVTARERASATVMLCENQLRHAQGHVRRASERHRQALNSLAEAEGALAEATRWLDRIESSMMKAG